MTEKKLTPRVGDRVTFQFGGKTYAGNLVQPPTSPTMTTGYDPWTVVVDGSDEEWRISPSALTVVDRERVEWPEGWEKASSVAGAVTWKGTEIGVLLDRKRMERIVADGPYLLEHWDELMGGDS